MSETKKPLPILRVRDDNGNEYPIPAVGIMGPKGDRGEPGPAGQPGMPGAYYTPYVHQIDADKIQFDFQGSSYGIPPVMPVSVTLPAGKDGDPGKPGDPGKDAPVPSLSIGTVTTLDPGSQATAEMIGPITDRKLNLGIPQGKDGSGGGTGGPLQPLTFTGAVSAEYDGTKPVSVEVPAPGGAHFFKSIKIEEETASYFVPIPEMASIKEIAYGTNQAISDFDVYFYCYNGTQEAKAKMANKKIIAPLGSMNIHWEAGWCLACIGGSYNPSISVTSSGIQKLAHKKGIDILAFGGALKVGSIINIEGWS